jgi:hypothetical protein
MLQKVLNLSPSETLGAEQKEELMNTKYLLNQLLRSGTDLLNQKSHAKKRRYDKDDNNSYRHSNSQFTLMIWTN